MNLLKQKDKQEDKQTGGACMVPGGANGAPLANPPVTHGQPSANPGETQRVPSSAGNGTSTDSGTGPKTGTLLECGVVPGSGRLYWSEWCAICTPSGDDWPPPDGSEPGPGLVDDACLAPDVTPPSRQQRDQSVTPRDIAVTTAQGWCNWCGLPETVIPSQRQTHAESLPRSLPETPTQESAPMIVNPSAMPSDNGPTAAQVQALSGALDAAGKLHAQAFGSNTIRGLIEELGKCQQALAGFLPKAEPGPVAQVDAPSASLASPVQAPGQHGASESRDTPHAVNTLVATAYRATRDNLAAMQAARDELSMQMAHQRERLLDLQEHFGSEEDAMRAMQTYLGPHP